MATYERASNLLTRVIPSARPNPLSNARPVACLLSGVLGREESASAGLISGDAAKPLPSR